MAGFGVLRFNDAVTVFNGLHPATQTTGAKLTGAIDTIEHHQIVFIVESGVMGASGTLDFSVTMSATSGGTYVAVPNTAITQLVVASNNNQTVVVTVDTSKLANNEPTINPPPRFLKGSLNPGTASSVGTGVTILGMCKRHGAASDGNGTDVVQVVNA